MSAIWQAIEGQEPDRVALADADTEITYGALAGRPTRESRGAVDVVGDSTLGAVLSVLDAWRAGDAVVLLHPRLPAQERDIIARDVRSAPLPESCAAVVATSGTTGARRYLMLGEAAMIASARASAANLGWEEDDKWWLCMPTAHVGGLAIVVRCLLAGRTVFSSNRFSGSEFTRALRSGTTLMSLVPTMLHELVDAGETPPDGRLRAVLVGGGPCTPTLAARARRAGFPILLTWGMSEAGSQIATQPISARFSTSEVDLNSVGRPLQGFEVALRDGIGWVRGPALSLGTHPPGRYPPPVDSDGWLESRDQIESLDDGQLRILGRGTDMILSGGENVYPAEVESALVSHDRVATACVVGVPHPRWGEQVVAVVVERDPVTSDQLFEHVRARLGGYKTPRRVLRIPELPTNDNSKVDRALVREWAISRLSDADE